MYIQHGTLNLCTLNLRWYIYGINRTWNCLWNLWNVIACVCVRAFQSDMNYVRAPLHIEYIHVAKCGKNVSRLSNKRWCSPQRRGIRLCDAVYIYLPTPPTCVAISIWLATHTHTWWTTSWNVLRTSCRRIPYSHVSAGLMCEMQHHMTIY